MIIIVQHSLFRSLCQSLSISKSFLCLSDKSFYCLRSEFLQRYSSDLQALKIVFSLLYQCLTQRNQCISRQSKQKRCKTSARTAIPSRTLILRQHYSNTGLAAQKLNRDRTLQYFSVYNIFLSLYRRQKRKKNWRFCKLCNEALGLCHDYFK